MAFLVKLLEETIKFGEWLQNSNFSSNKNCEFLHEFHEQWKMHEKSFIFASIKVNKIAR